jgi:hypothetical protein
VLPGDTREFQYQGRRCRVTVEQLADPRDLPRGAEWVEISFPSEPGAQPLRRAIYYNALRDMTVEELSVMVGIAEQRALQAMPHSSILIAFVRPSEELLISQGEWNQIRAIASMSGCSIDNRGTISGMLSSQLSDILGDLSKKFTSLQRERSGLIWPEALPDFLSRGEFSIRDLFRFEY